VRARASADARMRSVSEFLCPGSRPATAPVSLQLKCAAGTLNDVCLGPGVEGRPCKFRAGYQQPVTSSRRRRSAGRRWPWSRGTLRWASLEPKFKCRRRRWSTDRWRPMVGASKQGAGGQRAEGCPPASPGFSGAGGSPFTVRVHTFTGGAADDTDGRMRHVILWFPTCLLLGAEDRAGPTLLP